MTWLQKFCNIFVLLFNIFCFCWVKVGTNNQSDIFPSYAWLVYVWDCAHDMTTKLLPHFCPLSQHMLLCKRRNDHSVRFFPSSRYFVYVWDAVVLILFSFHPKSYYINLRFKRNSPLLVQAWLYYWKTEGLANWWKARLLAVKTSSPDLFPCSKTTAKNWVMVGWGGCQFFTYHG